MILTYDISGINLEKLLRAAAQTGLPLRQIRRVDGRTMRARIPVWRRKALADLCERSGWEMRETAAGPLMRVARFLKRRPALPIGAALGVLLVALSSGLVLDVQIDGAREHVAEVRRYLRETGVVPGRPKRTLSLDGLGDGLALRVPGLSFAGVRFAGSTLIVDCQPAREGEQTEVPGESLDLVAARDGVITHIWVQSGTPLVEPGQAVHTGQILVRGEERVQGGTTRAVRAQGQVLARVWARADTRVSLRQTHTVETGQTRTRVTLCTPWSERVVQDAQPFDAQDVSTAAEPVVGLFLPVYRKIETFAEIVSTEIARDKDEACRIAQGAAEQLAKIKCPADAQILDKWTDYSMIDEEFVCATVILEYEEDIAGREAH